MQQDCVVFSFFYYQNSQVAQRKGKENMIVDKPAVKKS